MLYFNAVYNLLSSLVFSITPLPLGANGQRKSVGTPEKIPDKDCTFITREITAADGIEPESERTRLNRFIKQAFEYHTLYGLAPTPLNAFEEILNKFKDATKPIGRIRMVSHGSDSYMFCPMFIGGDWDFGMQTDFINALKDSDAEGLRYMFKDKLENPIFVDTVARITIAIRKKNPGVLAPFGIQASGTPTAAHLPYFQIVSDLYQVKFGTVSVTDGPTKTLSNTAQQGIFNGALNRIEAAVRAKLVTGGIADAKLRAFRDAVLAMEPGPAGMFSGPVDLSAGTVANVAAALAAASPTESSIRSAISGGNPALLLNHLPNLVRGLELFNRAALKVGATQLTLANINANANLKSWAHVGVDLFVLQNGIVLQNGVALTNSERATMRTALLRMGDFIRARIVSSGTFTGPKLDAFRDALENMDARASTILGDSPVFRKRVPDLERATIAMQNNFRTKLEHFRTLMKPGDKTGFDIRGCEIGKTPAYLLALREFMGATNKPTVSAPEWLQSFSSALYMLRATPVLPKIDEFISTGDPPHIRPADVGTSMTPWRKETDFNAHFTFIKNLFTPSNKRNFASLAWRQFASSSAPQGIPVLRLEAQRIDTLPALTKLSAVIERFQTIFEVAAGSIPNATTLTQLDTLQPLLLLLKTSSDKVVAATSPSPTQRDNFVLELSKILADVTAVGMTAPAAPTAPSAGASHSQVKNFANKLGTHVEAILNTPLNAFFTAVNAVLSANGSHKYLFNTGAPLLVQNAAQPSVFRVATLVSPVGAVGDELAANAIRSWMRIQWDGDPSLAATMNKTIKDVPITNDVERKSCSRVSMLTKFKPSVTPTTPAGIAPMPEFALHIIKSPP